MTNKNFNNNKSNDFGKSINTALNNAINNINFSEISEKIKANIDVAINTTLDSLGKKVSYPVVQTKNPKVCVQKLPEKSKSSAFKILSIFSAMSALAIGPSLMLEGYSLMGFITGFGVSALSLLITIFTWSRAKYIDKIGKNYIRFLRELGKNTVIPIRDLASATAQSEEDTVKDLLYMMNHGYFHQARIVENDSLFLLDIDTFKLYKQQSAQLNEKKQEDEVELSISEKKATQIINTAEKYLNQIDKSKKKIENTVFLNKIEKLNKTIESIVNIIKKYPDKAYVLDKFMDYYLPTTVKLIDSYGEFEVMASDDLKIQNSMKEIDKSITTITDAYEKIKIEMLSDRAMDVKTDIDTMNLLLNQEGLLEDDWSK